MVLNCESSAWTNGAIWNISVLPNPVGRFTKTSFLDIKAFIAFSCWGKDPEYVGSFLQSTVNIKISGISRSTFLKFFRFVKVQHSLLLVEIRQSIWRQEQVNQTGKGVECVTRATCTVWESGYFQTKAFKNYDANAGDGNVYKNKKL